MRNTFSIMLVLLTVCHGALVQEPAAVAVPQVLHADLQLTLFAAEPQIVTPIGIAVDGRGRVFVLESHTHLQKRDYPGPPHDQIKMLEDTDGDGRADRVSVFAEGFDDGMNLAFSPEGVLHLVHRAGAAALPDADGDGRADEHREFLRLQTANTYAHSGLLGLCFGPDGSLYVSRGNCGGDAWKITGRDGLTVSGHGDGGNIVRCDGDGANVRIFATGFWNPFDLKFDASGRLLCVDNDPDSRGPNRLLHIVEDGDYGFRTMYGHSGLHPYQAWNGELPGTLPMIAGTGEAPSGVLMISDPRWPAELRGSVLATVWAENAIERFSLRAAGESVRSVRQALIKGGRDFRPVGIAAAPDPGSAPGSDPAGAIYLTDWVKKDYPNHGHGRVWRLMSTAKATPSIDGNIPANPAVMTGDYGEAMTLACSDDPFARHRGIMALATPSHRDRLTAALHNERPDVRLAALLALRRASAPPTPAMLRSLFADDDEQVRHMAMVWAGEAMVLDVRDDLHKAVDRADATALLFETYLATLQLLTPQEQQRRQSRSTRWFSIDRDLDFATVKPILYDGAAPPMRKALAVRYLPVAEAQAHAALLKQFVTQQHLPLRVEAVRSLAPVTTPDVGELLHALAMDTTEPTALRCEAIAALGAHDRALPKLIPLLNDPDVDVQIAAARALRSAAGDPMVKTALTERLSTADGVLASDLSAILDPSSVQRAADLAAWQKLLAEGGDPSRGRSVFFNSAAACARCHRIDGRGGIMGPDLSHIGASVTRDRIIESIMNPSDEVSPEFQTYQVTMRDGLMLFGTQFHLRGDDFSIILPDGREVRRKLADAETWEAAEISYMPPGLAMLMTIEEFRDLVAFLSQLR